MKDLNKYNITLECLPEDIAIDDHIEDEKTCIAIYEDLQSNEYAWFCAKVTVERYGIESNQYLGACSYESESSFKDCPYYFDLIRQGILEIEEEILNNQQGEH